MIPEISGVMSRMSEGLDEGFSDPQIRFISNKHRPENCVRILENLLESVPEEDIENVLQKVQDIPGAMGAMILFTASKAQESNLPQNKLHLSPEDKLEKVKNFLVNHELENFFKASGVTKGGDLREPLGIDDGNGIHIFIEKEDIEEEGIEGTIQDVIQRIIDNDPNLRDLDLNDSPIGPAEVQALAEALKNNTTLTSLDLDDN